MKNIFAVILCIFSFSSLTFAAQNLDQLCKEDEDSTSKEMYSIQKNAKEGLIICGNAISLRDAKNDIDIVQYKKNGKTFDHSVIFTTNDTFMSYEIRSEKDYFMIRENLKGRPKSEPLFTYVFDCGDHKCDMKRKKCAVEKYKLIGEAAAKMEKESIKLQKLTKKNNSTYEKLIRQIFLDALAGDAPSLEFFKSKQCGWNNYIDIQEICETYDHILKDNATQPCK